MNLKITVAVSLMTLGLSSLTPALAEPFTDQGTEWTMASPAPNSMIRPQALPITPDGAFASSWGSGKTPTQADSAYPYSPMTATVSCNLTARAGFNTKNDFPAC